MPDCSSGRDLGFLSFCRGGLVCGCSVIAVSMCLVLRCWVCGFSNFEKYLPAFLKNVAKIFGGC